MFSFGKGNHQSYVLLSQLSAMKVGTACMAVRGQGYILSQWYHLQDV